MGKREAERQEALRAEPGVPERHSHCREATCRSRWMKTPKLRVARPASMKESSQSLHFYKPIRTQLNTTEPSLAPAQFRTFTLQLNLPLSPVWTEKLHMQAMSPVVWV